jgi:drug/metabolite transporter (DMT)-like permease
MSDFSVKKIKNSHTTPYKTQLCAMRTNQVWKWILFLMLCLIWGSSFKLMEESATVINPNRLAALRIFSAAVFFLPLAIFHFRSIPTRQIALVALNGTIGNLLPAFLFAFALNDPAITGPMGGILNALTPLCVVTIAILFYKDRVALHRLIGIGIGLTGLILLTLLPVIRGEAELTVARLLPTLAILSGTVLYGINVNLVAHRLQGVKPLHLASVSIALMIIPTALLLWYFDFSTLAFEDHAVQIAIWKGIALGIAGSALATIFFYQLLQLAGGLFASLVTYGIPVVAVIVGWIDNIKIDPLQILSLAIILSGVYLVNKRS